MIGLVSGDLGVLPASGSRPASGCCSKLIGVEIPSTSPALEPRTVVVGLAVGLVVTMVAAVAPAWAATRVAPMEALRDVAGRRGPARSDARPGGWCRRWASR